MQKLPDCVLSEKGKGDELKQIVDRSLACFNEGQKKVFDTIIGEIFPGATSANPFPPVESTNYGHDRGKCFFLDVPGGTGKIFIIRSIQALLELRRKNNCRCDFCCC